MNLNDFSKWLQYNRVKNLRGSEYFPYPLYIYIKKNIYIYIFGQFNALLNKSVFFFLNKLVILFSKDAYTDPKLSNSSEHVL